VRVDGRLLIDGGVLANCDLQAACDAGASDVIAVDLSADSGTAEPATMREVVHRAAGLMLRHQTDMALGHQNIGRFRVLSLRPRFNVVPALAGFEQTPALFQAGSAIGEQIVSKYLDSDHRVRPAEVVVPELVPSMTAAASARPAAATRMRFPLIGPSTLWDIGRSVRQEVRMHAPEPR
jgi:predicted acylesterase/phospholipase RssA